VVVTHGATTWARQGRHTGTYRSGLGCRCAEDEARALASVLSPLSFAAVLCSPLLAGPSDLRSWRGWPAPPCPVRICAEWELRRLRGPSPPPKFASRSPVWSAWSHGCPGGESVAQVDQRCQRVIALALALVPAPGQRVALFCPRTTSCGPWGLLAGPGGRRRRPAVAGHRYGQACSVTNGKQRVILRWNAPTPAS